MLGIWISELERDWKKKYKVMMFSAFLMVAMFNIWGSSSLQRGVFRFGEGSIVLNNLNAPWFVMDGMSLLMMAALLPMIYIDQLSGELNSGAYRLYALRPYRRFQLWLGKLLALAATTVVGVGIVYIVSMIGSKTLFASSDTAALYGIKGEVGRLSAEWYTIKFYGVFLLTCLAKLLFCSAVCVFISRPIIAFLVILGLSIVLYHYLATDLVFLFDPFRPILLSLQSGGSGSFWLYLIGSSILFGAISFWGWQRKVI